MIFSCKKCGQVYKRPPSRAKRGTSFCSLKCYWDFTHAKVTCTCKQCGKVYQVFQSQRGQTYCGYECHQIARATRFEKACGICSKTFFTTPARVKDNRGKYCSSKCYWKSLERDEVLLEVKRQRERKVRDRMRFGGNREKVLERDNHQCQHCQTTHDLVIHHIDRTGYKSVRDFKKINNSMENLLTLCRGCHTKHHAVSKDIV